MNRIWQILAVIGVCFLDGDRTTHAGDAAEWKAGVATVAITPSQPMWMAGYASRTKPSDGVLTELHRGHE